MVGNRPCKALCAIINTCEQGSGMPGLKLQRDHSDLLRTKAELTVQVGGCHHDLSGRRDLSGHC